MQPPKFIPSVRSSCAYLCTAGGCALTLAALSVSAPAQQTPPAPPIGHTNAKQVQVSGAVDVHDGDLLLGNGSAITAGLETVNIALTRGGNLRLCATTQVHLSHDRTIDAPDSSGLMMALDRGAIETNYDTGKYSDVLLTPDLRILISPPGHADLSVRVNARGDTCVDNQGADAPYITVTSQFDGGLYRLRPNQHVTFERGSLQDVVDTERESCGCPAVPAVSVAGSGAAGQAAGGPSSTAADTTFPLAVSEGLAPLPAAPTEPVVKPGEVHAEVTVPLTFNGAAASNGAVPGTSAPGAPAEPGPAAATGAASVPATPRAGIAQVTAAPTDGVRAPAVSPATPAAQEETASKAQPNFLHRVGHFFSRMFGGH